MREEKEGGEKGKEVGWEVSRHGWRDGGSNEGRMGGLSNIAYNCYAVHNQKHNVIMVNNKFKLIRHNFKP